MAWLDYKILKYMQILMNKEIKQYKKVFSIMSNLQTNSHLKLISKKWTSKQEASA